MAWKRTDCHLLLALPLILLATACGFYSFRGNLPPDIKSISIAPVVNQTAEFAVTDLATEIVTDILLTENLLRITDETTADSDLQITITRVTDRPSTYTAGETVQEWRLDINTRVVWYDLVNNRALFEKNFTAYGHYPPGGDIGSDEIDNDDDGQIDEGDEFGDPREFAIRTSIRKISEDVINEMISTW
jgi:hypothetical protein